jgi:hypothetical protein
MNGRLAANLCLEKLMRNDARHFGIAGGAALLLALCGCGVGLHAAQTGGGSGGTETADADAKGTLYCNVAALSGEERARHSAMTRKLIAERDLVVETAKGYEFQFRPEKVSVAELAEWVVAENKCCPFFYFYIDLEKRGRLVCLGLTGPEGVKAFIREEFAVSDGK